MTCNLFQRKRPDVAKLVHVTYPILILLLLQSSAEPSTVMKIASWAPFEFYSIVIIEQFARKLLFSKVWTYQRHK